MASAHSDNAGAPVWTGSAPGLANGFIDRPETGAVLEGSLVPGTAVALVSGIPGGGGRDWRESCGKTQLAVYAAQSLWQSRTVDLVIWLTATTRASVLSGYATAAAAVGSQFTGNADAVTARFLGWLRETDRPWLVVLDDLTAAVALDDGFPWPAGPPPGAGHHRRTRVPVRPGRARRPRRPVQPPGIAHLPDWPPDGGSRSAPGRHRSGRGPRRRAAGAGPGERGDRQLRTDVSRLPRAFRVPARPGGRRRRGRRLARGGRDHLVAVGRPRRPAVSRYRSVAAGAHRAARRQRDPERGPDRQRGP